MKIRQRDFESQAFALKGLRKQDTQESRGRIMNYSVCYRVLSLLAGVVVTSVSGCSFLGSSREPQMSQSPSSPE